MLADEIKPAIENISLMLKLKESNLIKAQTEEFERCGGRVQYPPMGASGLDGGVIFIPECKGATPYTGTTKKMADKARKGSVANKAASAKNKSILLRETGRHFTVRRNIRKTPSERYEVIISATFYGVFDTLEQAIDKRQTQRKILQMIHVSAEK